MDCFGMGPTVMESAWRHLAASEDRMVEHASSKLRRRWPCRKPCPWQLMQLNHAFHAHCLVLF